MEDATYIHRPYGKARPLHVTEEAPTYHPADTVMQGSIGRPMRPTKIPAELHVSNGEDRQRSRYRFKHRRCDYVRRVERGDDVTAIAEAQAEREHAWSVYRECCEDLQAALKSAWPNAKSVTEHEAGTT